jgi:hypothetical protein
MPRAYGRNVRTHYGPQVTGAGTRYHADPADDARARKLAAFDSPGKHIWVMAAAWMVTDPQGWATGGTPQLLDAENLVMLTGPGCLKCELPWSRKLAAQPCRGSLDDPPG